MSLIIINAFLGNLHFYEVFLCYQKIQISGKYFKCLEKFMSIKGFSDKFGK